MTPPSGYVGHRVRAEFHLAESTAAVLRLAYISERGPCPDLQIELDGLHRGVFHPSVRRIDRSETGEPGPVAGPGEIEVLLPASWLTAGRHELTVTTVFDRWAATGENRPDAADVLYAPDEKLPEARSQYGAWFGSYLRWREVSLTVAQPQPQLMPTSVQLRTTPFFVGPQHDVRQLIDVDFDVPAGQQRPAGLTLHHRGQDRAVPALPAKRDFGMFRWRVPLELAEAGEPVTIQASPTILAQQTLQPSRQWTLHLIPHVHLDLGFTDYQGKVLELHCRNIDRALDQIAHDPDFRFCVDGSVVFTEYRRTRSPRRVAQALDAIRAGKLGVNALHSNLLTGLTGLHDLRHALAAGVALPAAPGPVPRYANVTDVPTYAGALPAILAASGVDAFVGMANHHRAATDRSDELHLFSPVRWRGLDGTEILAHFADHYSQLRFIAADPQSVAAATDGLSRYLGRFERDDYLPTDLALIGTHADNEDLGDGDTSFVQRWNDVFAYPKLRVSTFAEYLAAVHPLLEQLPVHADEAGSYWEDGAASAAADLARYRQAQVLLPAAEHLAATVSVLDDQFRPNRTKLDEAWDGLAVAGEHTFTWARSTTHPHGAPVADQLGWKQRAIANAHGTAVDEIRRSLSQFAESLRLRGPGVLISNPHSWPVQHPVVEVDLTPGATLLGRDGKSVDGETLSECAGLRRVRVELDPLPAHGYRFLALADSQDVVPAGAAAALHGGDDELGPLVATELTSFTTDVWQVQLGPDQSLPVSLIHRPSGRELLDPNAPEALGQVVVLSADTQATGHERARIDQLDSRYLGHTDVRRDTPTPQLLGIRHTPAGLRLSWAGTVTGISHVRVELLLRDAAEVAELTVELDKAPRLQMESVSISLPIQANRPIVRYDRQAGWVQPAVQHGSGANNEWLTATSTVSVTDEDAGGAGVLVALLDTPLWSSSDIVLGTWPENFTADNGRIYALAMNNFWPCNTPAQQPGPVSLRFALTPVSEFDPAVATRFGQTARLSTVSAEITALDRWAPEEVSGFAEGVAVPLNAPPDCSASLSRTREDTITATLVNLSDQPTAGHFAVADATATPINLPGYGLSFVEQS